MARILQLTDLHVVAPGRVVSGVLDTPALLELAIDRISDRLAAIGPIDAVLVTGDVSDDGSEDSYALARAQLDRLGLPLLVVPGNHDAREPLREAFSDLPGMPLSGLVNWTREVGDTVVIGLDTLVEGQGAGRLRHSSLTHLRAALQKVATRQVILALHHPPLRTGIDFMDAIGLENASALEPVLAETDARIIVAAGHVHGVYHGQIGGHAVATAPSVCSGFLLDRRHDAPVGFYTGPTGFAVIDTGPEGVWSAMPLEPAEGPFPF